jgi:hypothetical protein
MVVHLLSFVFSMLLCLLSCLISNIYSPGVTGARQMGYPGTRERVGQGENSMKAGSLVTQSFSVCIAQWRGSFSSM